MQYPIFYNIAISVVRSARRYRREVHDDNQFREFVQVAHTGRFRPSARRH